MILSNLMMIRLRKFEKFVGMRRCLNAARVRTLPLGTDARHRSGLIFILKLIDGFQFMFGHI
jgi:hypothetical protein